MISYLYSTYIMGFTTYLIPEYGFNYDMSGSLAQDKTGKLGSAECGDFGYKYRGSGTSQVSNSVLHKCPILYHIYLSSEPKLWQHDFIFTEELKVVLMVLS